jgi:hypothetical protein
MLVDAGRCEGQAFAHAATVRGLPVYRFHGDLADVYCNQLAPRWREQAATALGGLTRVAPLFYLERLAWDAGLRLVFLGRHTSGGHAPAMHDLRGSEVAVDLFHDFVRVTDWPVAIACTLSQLPLAVSQLPPLSAVRDAAVAGDQSLFSWVLAPMIRRASITAQDMSA